MKRVGSRARVRKIDAAPPAERVVIFDEAQRDWNLQQTAKFMQQKKKRPGFSQSEPEFLISGMDRHEDWAVIVCLVGGGQEINTGEAGIEAWIDAVNPGFRRRVQSGESRVESQRAESGEPTESGKRKAES